MTFGRGSLLVVVVALRLHACDGQDGQCDRLGVHVDRNDCATTGTVVVGVEVEKAVDCDK